MKTYTFCWVVALGMCLSGCLTDDGGKSEPNLVVSEPPEEEQPEPVTSIYGLYTASVGAEYLSANMYGTEPTFFEALATDNRDGTVTLWGAYYSERGAWGVQRLDLVSDSHDGVNYLLTNDTVSTYVTKMEQFRLSAESGEASRVFYFMPDAKLTGKNYRLQYDRGRNSGEGSFVLDSNEPRTVVYLQNIRKEQSFNLNQEANLVSAVGNWELIDYYMIYRLSQITVSWLYESGITTPKMTIRTNGDLTISYPWTDNFVATTDSDNVCQLSGKVQPVTGKNYFSFTASTPSEIGQANPCITLYGYANSGDFWNINGHVELSGILYFSTSGEMRILALGEQQNFITSKIDQSGRVFAGHRQ